MEGELFEDGEELLLDNESDVLVEETIENGDGDLILSEDEEALFTLDPVLDNNDLTENADNGNSEANQQISDEILDIQTNLEAVDENAAEPEKVGVEDSSNDEDVLESLQIIQRNVKTGFDNLSLMGSVQVGLISFGIGAIIIYCYIGRFK